MAYQSWTYTCACYPITTTNKTRVPICPNCGQAGRYEGWQFSGIERRGMESKKHRELYGLLLEGPHAQLTRQRFAEATRACPDCHGRGYQDAATSKSTPDCPACDGLGSVWAKPLEEMVALRRHVLASYPEAAAPSSRLDPSFTAKERSIYLTRKITLREEDLERLSQITNALQQEALRTALKQGKYGIPDYAWSPVPKHLDHRAIFRKFGAYVALWERRLRKAGIATKQLDQIDPTEVAVAFWGDQEKLAAIAAHIKNHEQGARGSARTILQAILDAAFTEVVEATPNGTIYRGTQKLDVADVFDEVQEKLDDDDSDRFAELLDEGSGDLIEQLGGTDRGLLMFSWYADVSSISLIDLGGARTYAYSDKCDGYPCFFAALSKPVTAQVVKTFITHLFRNNGEDFHIFLGAELPREGITNCCPELLDRDTVKRAVWHLFRQGIWPSYADNWEPSGEELDSDSPEEREEEGAYIETYFKDWYREEKGT